MEIINSNDFETTIASGVVVVDFFADWCMPCKRLTPDLEELDSQLEQVKFVKVDTEQSPDLSIRYGIQSIPNLIIFKDGKAVDQVVGFTPNTKKELAETLKKYY